MGGYKVKANVKQTKQKGNKNNRWGVSFANIILSLFCSEDLRKTNKQKKKLALQIKKKKADYHLLTIFVLVLI